MKKISLLLLIALATYSCIQVINEPNIENENIDLLAPVGDVVLQNASVTFSWDELEDAEKYHLQVFSPSIQNAVAIEIDTLMEQNTASFTLNASTEEISHYEWRVRAQNSAYKTKYTTASFSIQLTGEDTFSDNVVVLTSPEENFETNQATINLSWETVPEATEYRIQIWQPDTNGTLIDDLNASETNKDYTFSDGSFVWQVKAIKDTESTEYTARNITVEATPPNTPTLLTPDDESSIPLGNTNFTWQRDPIAGSVEKDSLYLYRNESLTDLVTKQEVSGGSHNINITTDAVYYWQMKAFDEAGNESEYSETFSFTAGTPIEQVEVILLSPEDNLYTNQATQNLSWEAVVNANEYRVQIWQPDLSGTLISDQNTSNTHIDYTFTDGDFTWQVKAVNATQSTAYSARSITIEATPPNTPILLTPIDGSTHTVGFVEFTWQRDPIAGSVEKDSLYIYNDIDLTDLFYKQEVSNGSYIKNMDTAATYYWRMKAFDEAGNQSEFSSVFSFTLEE